MADDATTNVILNDGKHYIVSMQSRSDTTGESGVVKVNKSDLTHITTGREPLAVDVKKITWAIQGFTYVQLDWDHATDDHLAWLAPGVGEMEFGNDLLKDPTPHDSTGDILLTTAGNSSGDTYNILLHCVLRA